MQQMETLALAYMVLLARTRHQDIKWLKMIFKYTKNCTHLPLGQYLEYSSCEKGDESETLPLCSYSTCTTFIWLCRNCKPWMQWRCNMGRNWCYRLPEQTVYGTDIQRKHVKNILVIYDWQYAAVERQSSEIVYKCRLWQWYLACMDLHTTCSV